jgi:hypothetical protein
MSGTVIDFGTRQVTRPATVIDAPAATMIGLMLELQKAVRIQAEPKAQPAAPIWRPAPRPLSADDLYAMKTCWQRQLRWVEIADHLFSAGGLMTHTEENRPWHYRHPIQELAGPMYWRLVRSQMRIPSPTQAELRWKLQHKDRLAEADRFEAEALIAEDKAWLAERFANCKRLPRGERVT